MEKATAEAKRAYNREYQRKWREKNSEKVRAYQKKYRAENASRLKENSDAFYRRLAEKGQVNG